jgi:hypothetical protein
LGNTDADLVDTFGAPVGESATRLAVYRRNGVEHQAQLLEVPTEPTRRAAVVVERAQSLTYGQAVQRARGLLPRDAQPRSAGPEGNAQFIVERFSSALLAATLPAEWFAAAQGERGDVVVVYNRRPDGAISDVLVGVGNDPNRLRAVLR